jgi:phage baseplate assembly protein W
MAEIDIQSTQNRQYKDLSLTFGRNPVTNDVITVSGVDAVKRAIKNLLLTQAGEVPFFPDFGSRLQRILFEPIDAITSAQIESEIRAILGAYEPRCGILQLLINPTPDESQYQVDLVLQLVNLVTPITLTLFLQRLR